MKAQRRHDLKQNVLDAELGKLVGFFRRRGTQLLWGVVGAVLIGAIAWYAYSQHVRKVAAIQTQHDDLVLLQDNPANDEQVIKGLGELADQVKVRWIAADACVRLGDLYARQALASASPADTVELIGKSSDWYRKPLADHPDNAMAVAKAHLGLGLLAETQGAFAEARKEYQAVTQQKGLAGYPVATLAEKKLAALAALESPVRMATTLPSQPATAPAADTQPASASAPSEAAPADKTPQDKGADAKKGSGRKSDAKKAK